MAKRKNKFADHIDLDDWSIYRKYFDSEADFRRALIEDINDLNKDLEADEQFTILNQDEKIIPAGQAYVRVAAEAVYAMIPIYACFPNDFEYDEEKDRPVYNRKEKDGITRGYLQWQLANALSGVPLFDHVFIEGLSFDEMMDGMPVYDLHMGS